KARTQIDYWVTIASLFGYSMPTFWLGLILILIFSLQLGWFPTMGMVTLGTQRSGWSGVADVAHHLVLPTITLGTFYLAIYALLMGLFLIVSVCLILMNLITDLLYTLVDPRIRHSAAS